MSITVRAVCPMHRCVAGYVELSNPTERVPCRMCFGAGEMIVTLVDDAANLSQLFEQMHWRIERVA